MRSGMVFEQTVDVGRKADTWELLEILSKMGYRIS